MLGLGRTSIVRIPLHASSATVVIVSHAMCSSVYHSVDNRSSKSNWHGLTLFQFIFQINSFDSNETFRRSETRENISPLSALSASFSLSHNLSLQFICSLCSLLAFYQRLSLSLSLSLAFFHFHSIFVILSIFLIFSLSHDVSLSAKILLPSQTKLGFLMHWR